MAYAAAISLKKTLDLLSYHRISLLDLCSNSKLRDVKKELSSMEDVLRELDSFSSTGSHLNRKRINLLDEQIRILLHEFEDVIESRISPLFLSQDTFIGKVKKMKALYIHELHTSPPYEEEEEAIDNDDESSGQMVGLSDQLIEIKHLLASPYKNHITLYGTAGIGKTTIARKFFQDPLTLSTCTKRAFVTVGPIYRFERVLLDILEQVTVDDKKQVLITESLDGLERMVYLSLKGQRYFIVLDDVWDYEIQSYFGTLFPKEYKESKVVMTTRLKDVARGSYLQLIRFLDKKESWELLRHKVFDEMPCPNELEKAGKKIAENCEGLPLTIVKVAQILSESDKTAEYWNEVELKPIFLYMGVFPQNYESPRSKLAKIWHVEGFCSRYQSLLKLDELDSSSLIMLHKIGFNKRIKTCSLYSPFWHLCNKEATKSKFFHALNSLADGLAEERLESQRRLCIRNNSLFAIKDVYDTMSSISTVRSLLCTGPYHEYPVPVCFGFRLLRILDALTARFYEFPLEVVNLIQLLYLALTFEGNIPSSISRLWNLRYLIVRRHLSVVKSKANSLYMPTEIWDMKELIHLQVAGSDLPHPREESFLGNLYTLLDVGSQSCTRDVFERIPSLMKLGIRIEVGPADDVDEPFSCFNHISHLRRLERLKCVVVNPRIISKVVVPLSIFPSSLKKLTLTGGFGYPWEEMSKISSLPKLRELKLRCYAFRGPEWKVRQHEFQKLRFLLIEDTDLVQWTFEDDRCFESLETLSLKHCYKLQRIPLKFYKLLSKIEVVDCNPLASTKLKEDREKEKNSLPYLVLNIYSSLDE
ncbi:hypothetical protein MIMGU_mgv1a001467mg [Erythranthe guttata]|uniref:NB-ARC domain-containing protein n=1 Tax=Erythranthe guttata TaxID=4155 RepID=A0A022PQL2_ERYGU|nr:hypothetical protein MIMGU_mgv1a001467mg [Erythranthe guttata]